MVEAKYIEVVRSNIKQLSSLSHASAVAIVASLSKRYSDVRLTTIDSRTDLEALIERKPTVVFLGMRYLPGEGVAEQVIWISQRLEAAGIPHTGSNHRAHQLGLNKDRAKQRVLSHGLTTASFCVATAQQPYITDEMRNEYPLFVKPTLGGGGEGIDEHSVVRDSEQLHSKISSLRDQGHQNILIERYLDGREFSVAIIKNPESGVFTAMPLELIPPENNGGEKFLSLQVKSLNQEVVASVNNPYERAMLSDFALDVFHALGGRDYGRVDIRLDREGVPHFLEVNLIPSLIDGYGSFPKAYQLNAGVGYDEMLDNIVSLALSRAPIVTQTNLSSTL